MGLEAVTKCLSKGTQLLDLVTKDFKIAVLNIFTEWKKIKRIKLCYNELINRYSHKRYKLETRARDKDHPQEKEMQKSKMAVWGGITNSCEKKRSKEKRQDISSLIQSSKEEQGETRKHSRAINAKK